MGYPLKKILASLPPGPRPPPHFHRRGGAPACATYNRSGTWATVHSCCPSRQPVSGSGCWPVGPELAADLGGGGGGGGGEWSRLISPVSLQVRAADGRRRCACASPSRGRDVSVSQSTVTDDVTGMTADSLSCELAGLCWRHELEFRKIFNI